MKQITYNDLNAQLNVPVNGAINLRADRDAARAYHLEEINPHTRFYHSLEEKTRYMLDEGYWDRATVEMYPFEQFKALFKQAHAHKFRFKTLLGAMKFYKGYATKEIIKQQDGSRETVYLERFEDRVVLTAVHLSGGDYDLAKDLVEIMITGRFQPATPTFLNAGKARGGEMVSCFLLRVEDNMESIGRGINSALQLSKRGGGVGLLLTNLRESGAPIQDTPDVSSGVVPVMKILEDSFSYANQLGARQGAGAVYLNAHHPDIMTFLDTKRENADEKIRIKTLSLGVVIPDVTFHLAKDNKDMYLFSPYDVERVEGKPFADCSVTECYDRWVEDDRITKTKIKARHFFQTLSELQFESGYPFCLFEDTANRFHPMNHAGKINMSNLCYTGDTQVLTDLGYRTAKDLYETQDDFNVIVDERARTMDFSNVGTSSQLSTRMAKTAENVDVFKVSTAEGFEIRATEWHKFYVERGGEIVKIPLAELSAGDRLLVQGDKSWQGTFDDPELAMIAGAVESDGTFTGKGAAHISLHGEKKILKNDLEIAVTNVLRRYRSLYKVESHTSNRPVFTEGSDGRITLRSKPLGVILNHFGAGKHGGVPQFVMEGNNETRKAFISTYLNFDGCLHKQKGKWHFTVKSVNREGLQRIQMLLLNFGVYSRISLERKAGTDIADFGSGEREYSYKDTFKLVITDLKSRRNLVRVVDLLPKHAAKVGSLDGDPVKYPARHRFTATVESITHDGVEDVYDVTVDNGHSQIANGIATGNCSEISQLNTPSVLSDDLGYEVIGSDISCNLGSLNVKKMLDLTQDEFVDTVITAVRALTKVSRLTEIDSVPSVREGNNRSRAIGLGQMNLHGALAHHGLEYGSPEALKLWDNYMALVTWAAMLSSAVLAREIGETPYFDGSEYDTGEWWERVPKAHLERTDDLTILGDLHAPDKDDWNDLHVKVSQCGLANAYLQTIPPTGSISYVNNSTASIHPIINKVEIRKEGKVGRVYYPAPHMRTDNLHLFKDAYEIGPEPIIDTYAVSQKWVDQSQSLTLFFKDTATTRDLDRARIYAWRKGVKSLYYIRLRQMALDGTAVKETGVAECESCLL